MSLSWSNVPLDLLISIRNKLHNDDLFSFRSVCCQWCSASPIPNPCPSYRVADFDDETNIIKLALYLKNGSTREHFISLPFSSSSPFFYFDHSNGWLVFTSDDKKKLYLFDPVSNRKFIFPHLNPMLDRYYEKIKLVDHDAYNAIFSKVVVSWSINTGIAVAGIVYICGGKDLKSYRIIVFYRHGYGDCKRWSLLMEESKDIMDIALAGDNRFYAVSNNCELYMLDERPPLIKFKKIKLWLPKHILEPEPASSKNSLRPVKRLRIIWYGMEKSGETDLTVYGRCRRSDKSEKRYISLEINVAKLNGYSNNIEVACDAEWSNGFFTYLYPRTVWHHREWGYGPKDLTNCKFGSFIQSPVSNIG